MRIRKNAHNLATWDPIFLWYAAAVSEMQTKALADPLSWRYQAAIHEYDRDSDPNAISGEPLPTLETQCQHASWFFLPWHRAYLYFFERIVAATIVSLGGPADWALPFWNYADLTNPDAQKLPAAFQALTLPNGRSNPLRIGQRAPAANSNLVVGTLANASDTTCLGKPRFVNESVVAQFGGGQSGPIHSGTVMGACERAPHGTMHSAVGGLTGWMSSFNTAALDPIFWLHHANIDRLWELWRRQDATHTDPIEGLWLTGAPFTFHDSDRSPVTITASQMVDIQSPLLNYDYEGLPARVGAALGAAPSIGVAMRESRPIPEMVGASSTRITLGGQPSIVSLTASAPQGPAASPPGGAAATHSVHLVLENVKALDYPVESYGVYVNVREGDRAEDHPELLAGILPGFGLVEASRPDNEHGGGSGLNHSFDITPIVEDLASRSLWNPAELRVSFVPVRSEGDRVPGTETAPVQVGRVSLYYS